MTASPESWERIARALGARMAYQAEQCPNGDHEADIEAATCPYCGDTIAYRRFASRLRNERYTPQQVRETHQ
jgi:hypothetical protein